MANFVTPDPDKVLLVDISKWQNDINTPQYPNLALMKSKGVSGVIMKAGQGEFVDRDFKVNWQNAKDAGLPRGSYWYYDNRVDPKKQAELYLSLLPELGELGLWVDLESTTSGLYMGWKNWYNFISHLQSKLPRAKIGIYTGHYYWTQNTLGSNIPKASLNWFKQFPLWIATYGDVPLPTKPWGEDCLIWQFTDFLDGKSYGAESAELDGNYFSGTMEDYLTYFNITNFDGTTEETKDMTEAQYNCVARYDVKVRPTPDTLNTSNSKIYKNTAFQISEIVPDRLDPNDPSKVWGKIFGGQYDGMYTALEYPNYNNPISTYTLIDGGTTPPPPPPSTTEFTPYEVSASITPDGKLLLKIDPKGNMIDSIWVGTNEYIPKT